MRVYDHFVGLALQGLTNTTYKFSDNGINCKLSFGLPHDKWGLQMTSYIWSQHFSYIYIYIFWCATFYLKCQLPRKVQVGKRTVYNLWTRIYFSKKSRDQLDQINDQLHLSKSILNVSFN